MTTNKGREIISKINMLLKNAHAKKKKIERAENKKKNLIKRIEEKY